MNDKNFLRKIEKVYGFYVDFFSEAWSILLMAAALSSSVATYIEQNTKKIFACTSVS